MKRKIVITENQEFQIKNFKIPENISFGLRLYAEKIDATENSIVNGLLKDFIGEIDFGTMIYNTVINLSQTKEKLKISAPEEHLGFNEDGNSVNLEKHLYIDAILTNLTGALSQHGGQKPCFKYSFKGEQETTVIKQNFQSEVVEKETISQIGVFNTFEELLSFFKVDSSWNCQINSSWYSVTSNKE